MSAVTLLVTGSIAAYKSCELVRELVKSGHTVHVALSDAAQQFVTPLTLQTLSGNPVATDLFDPDEESRIGHIQLADSADVVVLCPASADTIAKAAAGMADNIVTAVLLATRAPIVCAPAMNVNMWHHPQTQENVAKLVRLGWRMVPPEEGELACGWIGEGRLADVGDVRTAVEGALGPRPLAGRHVVVTAGPTREPLDPVRFISNRSSGRMGYALARQAVSRGAVVTLISGPSSVKRPAGVEFCPVVTALEMEQAVFAALSGRSAPQVLIMAAAVTDFRPAQLSATKLKQKKDQPHTLSMSPNPDILRAVGEWRSREKCELRIIGFAAEDGSDRDVLSRAREKLVAKGCDLIVANRIDEAFERETNRVWLVGESVAREVSGDKDVVARAILDTLGGVNNPG